MLASGSRLMKRVVLRVGDDGSVWVTCECRGCGHVHDGRAVEAILAPVICKHCHREMDIRGAIIDETERSPRTGGESA
jgi:hypothetical protein